MTGNRAFRVAATGARVLTGAVVAGACVVGVAFGITAPWPTVVHQPAQAQVTPLPGDTVLVCNGDMRAVGRDPSNPLEMVSAASPQLTVEGSSGRPESTPLSARDLADGGSAQRLVGAVEGRQAPLLGATESASLAEADLSGLAAAPCRPAGLESWLVGGTVATGTEDLVVLTNPGVVPSTVSLGVYGSVRASSTVIVPAESQIALPLTSIAAGSDFPIVKVEATGAPVRAVLQSSLTRTLDPAGIDLQDAVPAAQREPVLPGIEVFENQGDNADMAVLRLMSPEVDSQAVVKVSEVGSSTVSEEFTVPLTADVPTELSLSALSPGSYTMSIESDNPVLAGVRQQDVAGPKDDFAWVTSAPELEDDVYVAVPAGPSPRVVLANREESDATVQLAPTAGGDPIEVTVPAGSSASVDVKPRTVYAMSTSAPVHASVAMSAAGELAVWPVWPATGAQQSITVYP
ncbi:DUF5719 family protein [Microbacterium sp. NPDC088619]|uniref:DUF5719 family protein n=1 Tax=Microbacterium sp. NPDC088619 TaxID=3364196 RepID=UPI0038288B3E